MLKPSFYVMLFLFSAVVSSRQAVAQNLSLDYQLPLAKSYSVENGLSQVTVSDIAQDKDGYIWLATQSGVDRFDGYDFIHYGQSDDPSKGLSSAFVYAIEIDPSSGDLWIGTLNGLNVMRAKTRRFEQLELPNDFDDNDKTIHSIHIDEGGSIFVGTQKGLYAKYAGENEFLRLSPQAEIITVEDIAEHDEQLFIATSAGLYSLDKMSRRFSLALLEEQNVESVFVDNQSHLWIGTIGDGLYRAKLTNDGFSNLVNLSVEEGFTNNLINDIYQVRDNSIWVATTNGLSIFPDPNKLDFVTFFESSSNSKDTLQSHIHTLFSTDNGLVFLGTNGNGVGVIDQNKN
ncbi:MAG: two-component regulator propeller domain-containing protein, partial [Glaciecola sp.]